MRPSNDTETMELADSAADAWIAALAMFSMTKPSGFYNKGRHGTTELISGTVMPALNGVISTARKADASEIALFADSPKLTSVPWSIQVRGDRLDPQVVATAAGHGLDERSTLPFMIKRLTPEDGRSPESGPRVRQVSCDEAALYRMMLTAGFELPPASFTAFGTPSVIEHPLMRSYLVEHDGVPVATSFGILVNHHVGVFNVAVPPLLRLRGHGRAATAAVLRSAYARGARTAFLHAGPMGRPLFTSMGFTVVENWTIFTA